MACGRLTLSLLATTVATFAAVGAAQAAPPAKSKPKAARTATKKRTTSVERSRVDAQVTATGLDNARMSLGWAPVAGAARYQVYRGTLLVGATATPGFTDTLLWPSTSYSYRVVPITAAGGPLSAITGTGTTLGLPATGFQSPFPASSVWNTPVEAAPTASNSSAEIGYFLAHVKYPNMTLRAWGVSVAQTHATDPSFDVPCLVWTNCTLSAFGKVQIPATAAPDPSADGQMAVYDAASGREWDMWQARSQSGTWTSSAGAVVSTAGNGVAQAGTAAGDAANFPLLGGLIRPEEISQGRIDHALVFGMPGVSDLGHVCPATHNDGSTSDPNALEEGTHLQLDPSVDVDSLAIPAWEKPVVRAMQTYGMYLRDGGGTFSIYAENPVSRGYDAWSKAGMPAGDSVSLTGIPWQKLRVVAAPSC